MIRALAFAKYDCHVREGTEDGELVHVCNAVRLDDQVYITSVRDFE
jgi:hypothetical protein